MDESFPAQVYALARKIPSGTVASYGQLATMLGRPRAARIVGAAMSHCRENGVPCHRVVKSDGSLCDGDAFGPLGVQREMLRSEGIHFLPDGRIDMARCRWNGEQHPRREFEAFAP